jgi:lipoate-protein ligase A
MWLLERTQTSSAENIALDEALLLQAESRGDDAEVLRLWESAAPIVVVGRASKVSEEVDVAGCRRDGIAIYRRSSGGSAVVAAPGSLMYAAVLGYRRRPELRAIDQAHEYVLGQMAAALGGYVPGLMRAGISDLAVDGRKVSGNSLRCRRDFLLYHGTLLYDMSLDLMERYLKMPPRQPEYRVGREHQSFVANLPIDRVAIRDRP